MITPATLAQVALSYAERPAWPGLCDTGKMQSPIDMDHSEKLRIYDFKFNRQPADPDIINDCNEYRALVKFADTSQPRASRAVGIRSSEQRW